MARPSRQSHAVGLTLFLWHICQMIPLECCGQTQLRLQPSINLHAPVTAFMFSCSGTQCTTPEGMKARISPVQ